LLGLEFLFPQLALSDVVVTSDRVTNSVNVRETPAANGHILQVLRPGEQLEYVGSVPGWHEVLLNDGRHGFVSKSWTRVVSGGVGGNFSIDVVDVGTGLAIVARGENFALIYYDGGSNDDRALGDGNRFLAFLKSQHADLTTIHHLILSHPHQDHVLLLPDIIARYQVRDIWDSGAVNDICGYRMFIQAVSEKPQAVYHSALFSFGSHPVSFTTDCNQGLASTTINLVHGSRIDHEPISLGSGASMTFLHADGSKHSSFNENSLVLRLDLGTSKILLMGDAQAGGRANPNTPPGAQSLEGILLACCSSELRADVLIVGHHGSKTSSRVKFLNAVGAGLVGSVVPIWDSGNGTLAFVAPPNCHFFLYKINLGFIAENINTEVHWE
jgi:Predicted hydrolase (metallo-beta-lactamase superfamily)